MNAPEQFETARLMMRRPRFSDAAAIFERYASDPEVTRFLGWPRHRTVDATKAFLQSSAEEWQRWPAGPYLITRREDGRLLGSTGLAFQSLHNAMTGYVLAKDAWGHGYATEALTGVIGVAGQLGVSQLSAICHSEHRSSRRVLEKCGFIRDTVPPEVGFPNLTRAVKQEAVRYTLTIEREIRLPGGDGGRLNGERDAKARRSETD